MASTGITPIVPEPRGVGLQVATAALDGEVRCEAALSVERSEVQFRVEHLDVGSGHDVAGGGVARTPHVESERHRLVGRREHDDVLEVQDDVGHVFGDPGDRVELVQRVIETHLRDGSARDGRQQRAAQ